VLLHFRRYRLSESIDKARTPDFIVGKATRLGFFPISFRYMQRCGTGGSERDWLFKKKKLLAEQIRIARGSRILTKTFALEKALGGIVSYPFGIRAIAHQGERQNIVVSYSKIEGIRQSEQEMRSEAVSAKQPGRFRPGKTAARDQV
jgi:hypothetical protein